MIFQVFFHNSTNFSLTLSEYSAGASLDDESSSDAREHSKTIPGHIDPGETVRFLLRGDIKYSFAGARPRNSVQPFVRAWTEREDIGGGNMTLKIDCDAVCPDEVRLVANRGEQVADFNPVISIFAMSEQQYERGASFASRVKAPV
jgi:hypothetical protein